MTIRPFTKPNTRRAVVEQRWTILFQFLVIPFTSIRWTYLSYFLSFLVYNASGFYDHSLSQIIHQIGATETDAVSGNGNVALLMHSLSKAITRRLSSQTYKPVAVVVASLFSSSIFETPDI